MSIPLGESDMKPIGRKLIAFTFLAAVPFCAGESIAVALVTPPQLPKASRATAPISGNVIAGDAAQLAQCFRACSAGGQTLQNFCGSLPDRRLWGPCRALGLGSEVACRGWCYLHWGT